MGKVLIIGGMHRSGTSLTAEWMVRCGVSVGKDLIPGDWSNPRGHFEDREISHFQRRILEVAGVSHYCRVGDEIRIDPRFRQEAARLIADRERSPVWGFKDPRTVLLLDFWDELLPEARYLFVFRHYAQVVASLLRRDRVPQWHLPRVVKYARVWERYNRDLCRFADRHSGRSLVLDVLDLSRLSGNLVEYMNRDWGLALRPVPVEEVQEERLLTRRTPTLLDRVCRLAVGSLPALYRDLKRRGEESVRRVTGGDAA